MARAVVGLPNFEGGELWIFDPVLALLSLCFFVFLVGMGRAGGCTGGNSLPRQRILLGRAGGVFAPDFLGGRCFKYLDFIVSCVFFVDFVAADTCP